MKSKFEITLPKGAPGALAGVEVPLSKLRGLTDAATTANAEIAEVRRRQSQIRSELDRIETDLSIATGEERQKLHAERDALLREGGGTAADEDKIARAEGLLRGVAGRREEFAAEVAGAFPALSAEFSEIKLASKTALHNALYAAINGAASLVEVTAAAMMLNEIIGVPGPDFLRQVRVPDPLFGVTEITMQPTAHDGDGVSAHWLLRVQRGELAFVEHVAAGKEVMPEPRRHSWVDDPDLMRLAETLRPYPVAVRAAQTIMAERPIARAQAPEPPPAPAPSRFRPISWGSSREAAGAPLR